jgi:hypothetical protein
MKTLSLWQPWAWLVAAGIKDVENRSWQTHYRGELLIHASSHQLSRLVEKAAAESVMTALTFDLRPVDLTRMPARFELGGLIGVVELVDCVRDSISSWAGEGAWHWVLRNARTLPFCPMRGARGTFNVDLESLPASVRCFLPEDVAL